MFEDALFTITYSTYEYDIIHTFNMLTYKVEVLNFINNNYIDFSGTENEMIVYTDFFNKSINSIIECSISSNYYSVLDNAKWSYNDFIWNPNEYLHMKKANAVHFEIYIFENQFMSEKMSLYYENEIDIIYGIFEKYEYEIYYFSLDELFNVMDELKAELDNVLTKEEVDALA